jgi:hypothetical protein
MREVWSSVCMGRFPIHFQQSSIFHSGHEKHIVRILTYLNFTTEHMNKVALLSDVHKGQQSYLNLWKIECIVYKKIWQSRQLRHDGVHSRGFETWSMCKLHYSIYIVIKLFKEVSLKFHVGGHACVEKTCISQRRKWSIK